jgi:hypothetical protein
MASLLDKDQCEHIAEFCFPNGVQVQRVAYNFAEDLMGQAQNEREILEEILFKQKSNLREEMFFFTVNGADAVYRDEAGRMQDLDDFFFKCLCVPFNDLVIHDGALFCV